MLLLGTSVAQGLRIPASRRTVNTRRGNSFLVTRPGNSSLVPATVHAATTGSGADDNDISSVRDIVYMASVTVAGRGMCKTLLTFWHQPLNPKVKNMPCKSTLAVVICGLGATV